MIPTETEHTVNPLLSLPGGAYLFQAHLRGDLIETMAGVGLISFKNDSGISSP